MLRPHRIAADSTVLSLTRCARGWSTPRAVIGGAARLPMCEDRTTHSFRSLPCSSCATLAWVSREGHSGRGHQTPACSRANRSTTRRRGVSGDARRKLEFSDGKSPDPSHDPQEIPTGRRADPSPSDGIRYGVPGIPRYSVPGIPETPSRICLSPARPYRTPRRGPMRTDGRSFFESSCVVENYQSIFYYMILFSEYRSLPDALASLASILTRLGS